MENAMGVIINITGSPDIGLEEVELASSIISETANEDANIIWGAQLDDSMEDEIRVTVIATGASFAEKEKKAASSASDDLNKIFSNINEDNDDDYYDIATIFNRNK